MRRSVALAKEIVHRVFLVDAANLAGHLEGSSDPTMRTGLESFLSAKGEVPPTYEGSVVEARAVAQTPDGGEVL